MVALFLLACVVLSAAPLGRGGGPLLWRAAVAAVVVVAASHTRLTLADLGDPVVAQVHGQGALVVARGALLACGVLSLALVRRRRRALWAMALVVAFTASWAVQALLVVLALAYAGVMLSARRLPALSTRRSRVARVASFAGVAAAVVVAVALQLAPAHVDAPVDDASAARAWFARDNPWRALPYARAWAAREPAPGAGALLVARIAARLGDVDQARTIAQRVTASPDAAVRADAVAFLAGLAP